MSVVRCGRELVSETGRKIEGKCRWKGSSVRY